MEVPQEIKSKTTLQSSNSISEFISKGNETIILKSICTLMFIAALFTIAKTSKQPKVSINGWMGQEKCGIYAMEYYSAL